MHFEEIEYNNIKGCSGHYTLRPLTVISGENGSGKSALLDACRLAATGQCSAGAANQRIARIMSASVANSRLTSGTRINSYTMRVGEKVQSSAFGDSLQGNLPVTVGDFWALTAEQRLGVVGGREKMDGIEAAIEELKEPIKALAEHIAIPAPPTPPMYSGPSIDAVEAAITKLSVAIDAHDKAVKEGPQVEAKKEAAKQLLSQYDAKRRELDDDMRRIQSTLKFLEGERDAATPIIRDYEAALAARPAILNGYTSFTALLSDVADAIRWANTGNSRMAGLLADTLANADPGIHIPSVVFDKLDALHAMGGLHPQKWHAGLISEIAALHEELSTTKRSYASLESEKEQAEAELAPQGTAIMSDDDYMKAALQLEELRNNHRLAQEWAMFGQRTGEWSVKRAKSIEEHNKLCAKLDKLKFDKAALVAQLKSGVETTANEMLARAGMKPLVMDIVSTAKKASLAVSVGGIAIEALATSERLVYGVCLLSAIHRHSDAPCPLLVAECAEMDDNMMLRVIDALGDPPNGNIILEHWRVSADSIVMEKSA
jgi:hypothetical protein